VLVFDELAQVSLAKAGQPGLIQMHFHTFVACEIFQRPDNIPQPIDLLDQEQKEAG
jgi:hypothetical protein